MPMFAGHRGCQLDGFPSLRELRPEVLILSRILNNTSMSHDDFFSTLRLESES